MSNNTAKRPEFYISEITCGDGTQIPINANDIIVFVGPNNSGKSQALKDIGNDSHGINVPKKVIPKAKIKCDEQASEEYEIFIKENAKEQISGSEVCYSGTGFSVYLKHMKSYLRKGNDSTIAQFFITSLPTENRLTAANPAVAISRDNVPTHPIHRLVQNSDYREKIAQYFRRAFGENIIPNPQNITNIPLRLGNDVKLEDLKANSAQEAFDAYSDILSEYPMLHQQGDGMRSFTGIILSLIAEQYNTFIIDEPESFLHPPQATIMGQVISELAYNRQVFISTHSQHIVKGLLDKDPKRVKIIRITRPQKNQNTFSILDNEKISDLWKDPLLKHSDIMDGMFYKNVVICESDADCRFYSMINSFLKEQQQKFSETLFVHCGGKGRMKKVVQALKSLNIDFRVIPDIDLLNDKSTLQALVEACGGTWNKEREYNALTNALSDIKNETGSAILTQIQNEIGADLNTPLSRNKIEKLQKMLTVKSKWDKIKESGIAGAPRGDATVALKSIVQFLNELKIFLVTCGELECFIKDAGGHGPEWLNNVLENHRDISAEEYKAARDFVASWNL